MSHTLLGSSTSESYSSGRVVTVVDDEITTLEAIQAILEYDGYEVWAFADAVSAHRRLTAARPDLVILDMMLRGRSGRAFLERLKSEPMTAAIPVIVCTAARLGASDIERLRQFDCQLLTKPFELEALLGAARQLTRR